MQEPVDHGTEITAGGAIFAKLKALGVDYVFVNSGTDFPPIIEGLAEAAAKDIDLPTPLIIPHEHAALGMAHGYYFATGQAQAVMLHTNVGLANGVIGSINAAADNVPVLMMSGRTPTTEQGRFGARTVPIGWGQEMRDQTALVREISKWDYELRFPEQIAEVLDRAHAIANSTPKGPVYLSLPREVLCEPCPEQGLNSPSSMQPALAAARPEDIEQATEILAQAKKPLIFAQRGAGSAAGFEVLTRLAEDWAIPVCHYWTTQIGIPLDHPMQVGSEPEPWLSEADAILVIDALAPWSPDVHKPRADAKIIQLGPNPLHSRTPIRNFRSDLSIICETAEGIIALDAAMQKHLKKKRSSCQKRYKQVSERSAEIRAKTLSQAETHNQGTMSKAYVSLCLSQAIQDYSATVLSELGCPLDPLTLQRHDAWYQEPHAGGLGWSLPCAMGMKLARPDQLVIATLGDGSYMFANPTACHQVMEAHSIAVLTIILNNAEWGAVRRSVQGLYPKGYAAKTNQMPLTSLSPGPDFCKVAAASRAWGKRVEKPEQLPEALAEAIKVVMEERQPAILDVQVAV